MTDEVRYVLCDACGGEGVIGGLIVGEALDVYERCHTCQGTGLVAEEADQ